MIEKILPFSWKLVSILPGEFKEPFYVNLSPIIRRFPIPLAADQRFTYRGRPLVAISPDGSQVVYQANNSLWLRPIDQLLATQVPGTEEEARGPFFSADGQSIGFWADNQLKKVSVSGGAPVTLADVPETQRRSGLPPRHVVHCVSCVSRDGDDDLCDGAR